MDSCTSEWISIQKDHPALSLKWNVMAYKENDIIEVTGCPEEQFMISDGKSTPDGFKIPRLH
jgi:hypothetical protein